MGPRMSQIPNEIVLLDHEINRQHQIVAPESTIPSFFNNFVADLLLRDFDLDLAEVQSGIVDGSHDCGIDAIYVLVNGILLQEDRTPSGFSKIASLELKIYQAKSSGGITESSINTLIAKLPALLSFARDEVELEASVNGRLIEITRRFINAWLRLEQGSPSIEIVFGAAKAIDIHPNVQSAGQHLSEVLRTDLGLGQVDVRFENGPGLWRLTQRRKKKTATLSLAENALASSIPGGYVCLVSVNEFAKFITLESGDLNTALFEANVRDYEINSMVNQSIQTTLVAGESTIDFWWLNNGVTIVSSSVNPVGTKSFRLSDPQIVNGLQTSTEIYKYSKTIGKGDTRTVLVKVVEAEDLPTQEAIIKATNSQTALGWGALRATDAVQRDIESYLLSKQWFYERRKNFYRNRERLHARIVPMQRLAQAVCACLLQEPHVSRDSVAQLFADDYYRKLYNPNISVQAYHAILGLDQQVVTILKSLGELRGSNVEDWQYQVLAFTSILLTRRVSPTSMNFAPLESVQLSNEDVSRVWNEIRDVYNGVSKRGIGVLDKIARSADTTSATLSRATVALRSSDWADWGPVRFESPSEH